MEQLKSKARSTYFGVARFLFIPPPMLLRLTPDFAINTGVFRLDFRPGGSTVGQLHRAGNHFTILLPHDFSFDKPENILWANRVVTRVLRNFARQYFPRLVQEYATYFDLRYNRVFVKDMISRWGSCSSLGNINLSLWLLLAPDHLLRYVVKHELAHLNEMNHGPRFWHEVDRLCGAPGEGKRLEREMKAFARSLTPKILSRSHAG